MSHIDKKRYKLVSFFIHNYLLFSIEKISYTDVLSNNLGIMDASAISLARDNNIPILVFSINNKKPISSVVKGKGISTIISA